jgi:hypothetical protein
LNKVTYPQDTRFSKYKFVVAPGLTVKSRLSVLFPSSSGNYYDEFNIVPPGLTEKLNQGKVLIKNWHALNWETEERLAKKKGVDKRGAKSNEAYVREVLGEMANAHGIIVINDEAHHAWRIHACYDFSATPFAPSGKKSSEEALFPWIVSDFGLNDAIESGLVKTPRVVIRDDGVPDAKDYKSRLYHIYEHVRDDLNRDAQEHDPLPDLVINGYYLLGKDWLETEKAWVERGFKTPPVMISVANRTETATLAELAPVVEGKPDFAGISEINLNDLANKFRMQRIIFETARDIYDQMKPTWKGKREFLLAQLIQLVEDFILSEKIRIFPQFFDQDDKKRRILITLNMNRVVHHIWKAIRFENTESITPVFNIDSPIRSTGDMRTWYTGKPCEPTKRSHINFCVFDSTWEASEAFELDRNPDVQAWVKNDHLGFEVFYIFKGEVRKYRPDFIIRLTNGKNLILETKGQDTQQDKTKREFLDEWVRAVNLHGGFGTWMWAVSKDPADVAGILTMLKKPVHWGVSDSSDDIDRLT